MIEGPPGAGKTRLLSEVAELAEAAGARVLRGGGDPDAPLVPLAPLLHAVISGPRPLLGSTAARALAAGAGDVFWVHLEVQDHLERAALAGPVVVCIDDLQWCDNGTLMVLRALPRRLSGHAILWVLGVRADDGTPAVRSTLDRLADDGAVAVSLAGLSDVAVEEIMGDLLPGSIDTDVLAVAHRAEGSPLLLMELIRGMQDEGSVVVDSTGVHLVGDRLPERFRDTIRQRLARMSPLAGETVQMASVLGRRFSLEQVAALLDRDPVALLSAVKEGLDGHLLTDDDTGLAFRHDLIREAVAATLPPTLLRSLRRRSVDVQLGSGTPLAEIAATLAETAVAGDGPAVDLLRQAAAELAATAPPAAAELNLRALDLTPRTSSQWPSVLAETIPLLWQAGRAAEARSLADSALTGLLPPPDEARVRLQIASLSSSFSFDEAARQCRLALALEDVPSALRADLFAVLALNLSICDLDQAVTVVPEALAAARASGNRAAEALALTSGSVVAYYEPDWPEAMRLVERAEALAHEHGGEGRLWFAVSWRAFLLDAAGRPDEALEMVADGLRVAQTQNQAALIQMWMQVRCRMLMDAGHLADARAEAEAVLEMVDELGPGNFADATVIHTLGRIAIWTGDPDGTRRAEEDSTRMVREGAPFIQGVGRWLSALLADAAGEPERAMDATADAVARFGHPGPVLTRPLDPTDIPTYVRIALRSGHDDRAQLAVLNAERLRDSNPDYPILASTAAHARGLLERDPQLLLAAATLFQGSRRILAHASALEDAASADPATDSVAAVEMLDLALKLYTDAGDETDAARVRNRLRSRGQRRRRRTPAVDAHGWHALTPSELEVVRLIADGATNRIAAQRLYLSPHTINSHLRRAFLKLSITSRVELTRTVLANEGLRSES